MLTEHLDGTAEAEIIKTDRFDYTKWREDKFEDMTLEELSRAAAEYAEKPPFSGGGTVI